MITDDVDQADEEKLLAAIATSTTFYRQALLGPDAAGPRRYLITRRLEHVLQPNSPWHVGYAGSSWTALVDHLRARGHLDQVLVQAGLALRANTGRLVDRFRHRIVIPVRRQDGQVVGFVGRAAPKAAPDVPRYLNTPDTPLYRKSRLLLGLAEQRDQLGAGVMPAIVEGPFDVLAIAGSSAQLAAVAPCGTALTRQHIDELHRVVDRRVGVLVATDNDTAGRAAAVRAHYLLGAHFGPLYILTLPTGADPAGLGQRDGLVALAAYLENPVNQHPLLDLVIDAYLSERDTGTGFLEHRINALRATANLLAGGDPHDASHQVIRIAHRLDLDPHTVTEAIASAIALGSRRR